MTSIIDPASILEKPKLIYVVDGTILDTIQSCARKAHYSFDKNLSPVVKPSYFEKGDLVHQMLEAYYKLRRYRHRWAANHKSHADIADIVVNIGRRAALKMGLNIETVEEVIHTLRQYMTRWAEDDWNSVVAVEESGSKILYEDEEIVILYQVKIDLIISLQNCPVFPVDHKSSEMRRKANEMANQFKGYCWFLGVNNLCVNKIGFQKTLKPEEKFTRETISYSQDIIDEWVEISTHTLKKYITDSEADFYPPNFTSCDKYSGCIFRDVCNKSPINREYKLHQLFVEKEKWDVGK